MCGARDHIYEFIVFLEKVGNASRHAMSPRLFLWSRSVLFLRGFRMSLSVLRRYNSSTYSASMDDLGRWFLSHRRRSCFGKLPPWSGAAAFFFATFLANDLAILFPPKVFESRATQERLKRLDSCQ